MATKCHVIDTDGHVNSIMACNGIDCDLIAIAYHEWPCFCRFGDVRQALAKATAGDLSKWFWFLKPVLWADRVTPRKGLGCSPYFIVLGAEPLLPFDIVESTWLVKLPNRILTSDELIGYRAQALTKHRVHVQDMIDRVGERKLSEL